MINIIVYEGHHVVGAALAIAVDARGGRGSLRLVAAWEQNHKQYGGNGCGWDCDAPSEAAGPTVLVQATLCIRLVYLFYQLVGIHFSFILRSFSFMRPMRVVTAVVLICIISPISAEENPSR